jgi:citronellol/citronellal dehydrogenase
MGTPAPFNSVLRADANVGRVALVTGGGTGIGAATAFELAATGAAAVICGRRERPLRDTAERIRAAGGECLPLAADIREPDDVTALLDAALERFGRIDVLVNNAGGQFAAPAEQITDSGWHAVQRLAVEGSWRVTRAVATRAMIPGSGGLIVFVGFSPLRGSPGFAHASAAVQRLWSWRARRAPTSPARRSRSTGASTHGVLGSFRRRRPGERS